MEPDPFAILPGTLSIRITTVKSHSCYNYYGVLNQNKIADEASKFIAENSNAKIPDTESAVKKFIDITAKDYGEGKLRSPEATWFTVRITKPLDESTPRWHRDGRMYTCDKAGEVNWKYAITLLGNPTRVMKESAFVMSVLDEGRAKLPKFEGDGKDYWAADKKRQVFNAERLAGQPEIEVPGGSIIRFSWGQVDSPLHSEPDMSTDRVFVSVLYGTETEMKDMCKIRETDYRS
jgi:hypothetical protein